MECSFCQKTVEPGSGKMVVRKDGTIFYFCSSKCEKNLLKLGHKAHKHKWAQAG